MKRLFKHLSVSQSVFFLVFVCTRLPLLSVKVTAEWQRNNNLALSSQWSLDPSCTCRPLQCCQLICILHCVRYIQRRTLKWHNYTALWATLCVVGSKDANVCIDYAQNRVTEKCLSKICLAASRAHCLIKSLVEWVRRRKIPKGAGPVQLTLTGRRTGLDIGIYAGINGTHNA